MPSSLRKDHPKQRLLFFVMEDVDDGVQAAIRAFVLRLGLLRRWLNGAPRFVNLREDPPGHSYEDRPIQTLGGYLEIYSALPPWTVPREIDSQHLDEVTTLIDALRQFSREHDLSFELELDGKFVGSITSGDMDKSLSEGLLGEWRRHLDGVSKG